jgi:hypothetical protein
MALQSLIVIMTEQFHRNRRKTIKWRIILSSSWNNVYSSTFGDRGYQGRVISEGQPSRIYVKCCWVCGVEKFGIYNLKSLQPMRNIFLSHRVSLVHSHWPNKGNLTKKGQLVKKTLTTPRSSRHNISLPHSFSKIFLSLIKPPGQCKSSKHWTSWF